MKHQRRDNLKFGGGEEEEEMYTVSHLSVPVGDWFQHPKQISKSAGPEVLLKMA